MDIKWIEDFLSLAATRNFSRSAEHRNVTQPAFSRRIRALEAWVGAELVDRSSYPLTLTDAGKLFNDAASESLKLLNSACNQLRSKQIADNMLRVTAGHSLALSFLPEWLDQLSVGGSVINARISATNIHDSVMALSEGECDLLLCFYHPQLPLLLNPDQYAWLTIGNERILPVSAPDRNGATAFQLPGSKSKPTRLLAYPSTSFLGRVTDLIIAGAPATPVLNISYESEMAELLKRMAVNGHGLSWLPERLIRSELDDGRLLRAGGEQWQLNLEIRAFRALQNRRPALNSLWEQLSATDAPPKHGR